MEHPFFVDGRGWTKAAELSVGDSLVGHDGKRTPIDRIYFTDQVARVYNLRVAEFHTYFVGARDWGFSVWAHNLYEVFVKDGKVFYRCTITGVVKETSETLEEAQTWAELLNKNAPNSKFRGGKHGDTRFPRGDGLDSNHSPADAISPFRRDDGPAFQMDPRDHRRMSSTGSSKEAKDWRQKQKDLIAQGKLREAVQMDIDEARRLFPGKYDDAIQEMLDYITSIGY